MAGATGRALLGASIAALSLAAKARADPNQDHLSESATSTDAAVCAEQAQGCFLALGFTIDGASAIAPDAFLDCYSPYLGRPVSLQDLAQIAQHITDRYRARGYFLTRAVVPPQNASGIARIVVVEGRISDVTVEGSGAAQAGPYFRDLNRQSITDIHDLDRRIALAGDVPGLEVHARVEPIADDPHRHRLIVTATLTRGELRGTLDNRGARTAGPLQAYARITRNALALQSDQLGLGFFTTPVDPREFSAVDATYVATAPDGGRTRIGAAFSHSRTVASPLNPDSGNSAALDLGYEIPLLRKRGAGLWLGAAFDLRHQENDDAFIDELRVARFGLRGFLDDGGQSTTVFAQASIGLPILGASGSSPNRSRAGADASFTAFQVFASHYSAIGDHFGLYAAVAGQWSASPLLIEEQFSAGGPPFGRAFSYGDILGDDALAAELEFRAGLRPSSSLVSYVEAYAFVDGARVWLIDEGDASLASAGAGLRLNLQNGISAGWEAAHSFAGVASADSDWRQFFSISTLTRY